ncbi:aminopeptidase P family protein [Enterococcus devriesei]|uniref:aminopeptidase P family protein n=1 Tax=Enterococcus devriesei TaxID=319970 RepID=UPI001C1124FF|nr:aminopeptidase P family protein [Enterococcus devriesei]MBU5366536.1 aminopeptidase P family protein [Enterococcus devriesei]MDT2821080.1 aminopeptidase P family protein [Enterococcus devriesei]
MRIEKLQQLVKESNNEAVIIKNKENKKYFGSLGGSGIYLVVTPTTQIQFFDGRYRQEIKDLTSGFENSEVLQGSYLPKIFEWLKKQKITKVAIEPNGLSIQEYQAFSENFEVTIWSKQIQQLRAIKSNKEIQLIKKACSMTDEIFAELLPKIKIGMKENELGALIHYLSLKKGASAMAFDPIVASGPRSALPHGRPTQRAFQSGDFITIDFGIVLDDYQSDMTRTVALGEPNQELREIYQVVKEAQQAAADFVKIGVTGQEVDAVARKVITEAGYGEFFSHGLGHGIGMGGDGPILNPKSETILKENMVMSVEPGIYLPGVGGVRIEDDVMIENKIGVPLNQTTKELLVVGECYV